MYLLVQPPDFLGQPGDGAIGRRQPVHALLDRRQPGLQRLDPLIECVEPFPFRRQTLQVPAHEVAQLRPILFELRHVLGKVCPTLERRLELRAAFLSDLLDPLNDLVSLRGLPRPLVELRDLNIHVPDHLIESVRLDHRMLDRMLLVVEHADLLRDVLRERVQRRQPLFGALAQLVQRGERNELLFDVLDRLGRRVCIFARLAQAFFELAMLLGQLRRERA